MQPAQLYSLMLLAMLFSPFSKAQGLTQPKSASAPQVNKLAGTWKLVEYADFDSVAGKWQYDYGQHPKGFFTYTPGGIVNLNISADRPLKIPEDSAKKYNINLLSWLYTNSLATLVYRY
ncbi:lipocalin-like domain-containing protein [Foetidibacter luteolus]|uniref:lipocalin-like domain-containing protein n=1 Tax=Foetidibacter luteolus TaxID=2608880 RepID=UPI00129B7D38|nr:lipocalin-like domain-containing protein [Foetidibacter luteolus]